MHKVRYEVSDGFDCVKENPKEAGVKSQSLLGEKVVIVLGADKKEADLKRIARELKALGEDWLAGQVALKLCK